jgi:hypothetical protein
VSRYVLDPRIALGPSRLDWIMRYEPVLDFVLAYPDPLRILDFGSGHVGFGAVYAPPFAGIDLVPIVPAVPNLQPITGVHPFDVQATVDLICAMDVLEHIPPVDRDRFFATLRRVSARFVILSYPTAQNGRAMDLESTTWFGTEMPSWLIEHLAHPHPDTEWVEQAVARHGFRSVAYYPTTPRLQHYLGCLPIDVAGASKIQWLNDFYQARMDAAHAASDHAFYRDVWVLEVAA